MFELIKKIKIMNNKETPFKLNYISEPFYVEINSDNYKRCIDLYERHNKMVFIYIHSKSNNTVSDITKPINLIGLLTEYSLVKNILLEYEEYTTYTLITYKGIIRQLSDLKNY